MAESYLTGLDRDGNAWVPHFIQSVDRDRCLGCGRCYKVCGRDVFDLEEYTDENDTEKMVMVVVRPGGCIGCQACVRVCPKGCHAHLPMALTA